MYVLSKIVIAESTNKRIYADAARDGHLDIVQYLVRACQSFPVLPCPDLYYSQLFPLTLHLNIRRPLSNDRRADRHVVHDDRRHAPVHAQITCFPHCRPDDSPTSIMSHRCVFRLLLIVSDRVHSWTTAPVQMQRITTTARYCSMLRLTLLAFGRVSGP